MTDLEFMKTLLASTTFFCSVGGLGMIHLYRKLSKSMSLLSICSHHIIINKGVVEYQSKTPEEVKKP